MTGGESAGGNDLAVVTAIMAELGRPAPDAVTRMVGHDAIVWRAQTGPENVAVRLLPRGRSPDRELAAMHRAVALGPVVPQVLVVGQWRERAVIVMSWLSGKTLGDLLVAHDNVDDGDDFDVHVVEIRRLGRMFGTEQARLHDHDIAHLDFHPFNVLTDGEAVTGIVDWNNCRPADLRLDLALTLVLLEFGPALLPGHDPTPFIAAWKVGYTSQRSWPPPADLAPFLAAASAEQASNWEARVAEDAASPSVGAAARAIADKYADGGVSSSGG